VKRVLTWSGVARLLFAVGCGGGDKESDDRPGETSGAASVQSGASPTAAAGAAPSFPGDRPASPETARIDRVLAAAKLPTNVDVAGRKDIPNDAPDYNDAPDVVRRFKEFGRETGGYYVLAVNGTPRLTLAISRYAQPDGATRELDFGAGTPNPDDRIDAAGIGDKAAAFRVRLGGQGGPTPVVVSFTRGPYYVVVADTAAAADAPPDMALDVARAVDEQLKVNPGP
jgi:hypothetical protein